MADRINLGSFSFDSSQVEQKLAEITRKIQELSVQLTKAQNDLRATTREYLNHKQALDQLGNSIGVNTRQYRDFQRTLTTLSGNVAEQRNRVRELTASQEQNLMTQTQLTAVLNDLRQASDIVSNGYSTQSRNIEQLTNDHRLLSQMLEHERSVNGELSASVSRLQNDLQQNSQAQDRLRSETSSTNNEISEQTQEVNQNSQAVRQNESRLESLANTSNDVSENVGGVSEAFSMLLNGNIAGGLQGLRVAFTQLTTSALAFIATPIGAIISAVAGVAVATKALFDYNQEMSQATAITRQFTNLNGEDLENFTVKVKTFAEQTGSDMKEVTRTVNSVAQAFGLSYDEAFEKVQAGFIRTGASAEDFFDNTDEYGAMFQKAGYSADEFFAIMEAGAKNGIYKDKLIDSIKEVDLRLKDLSKGGREALEGAFGKPFTDKLVKGVESGSISTKQALQMISSETKKVGVSQGQMQKISADVFGAMGEDSAGFVKVLSAVEDGLSKSKDGLTELQKKQKESQDAQIEFNQAFADLFNLTDGGWDSMMAGIKTVFFNGLTKAIKVVVDLANGFVETYNNSLFLRAVIGGIGQAISTNVTVALTALKLLWNGLKYTGKLLASVLTFDLKGVMNALDEGWSNVGTIIKTGASTVVDDINNTIDQVNKGKLEKIKLTAVVKDDKKENNETKGGKTNDSKDDKKDKGKKKLTDSNKELKEKQKLAEEAEKAYKAELENQIKLLEQKQQLSADFASNELANKIKNSQSLIDEDKRLSEELINQEKARLDSVAELKKQQAKTDLDSKLSAIQAEEDAEKRRLQNLVDTGKLTQSQMTSSMDAFNVVTQAKRDIANQEYKQKEVEFVYELDEAKKEAQKQIDEQDLADKQLAQELEHEARLLEIEENAWFNYDAEKAVLDQVNEAKKADLDNQYKQGLISEANYVQAKANLEKKYQQDMKALQFQNNQEKAQNLADSFGAAKGLFKENTVAYKAMAIGEATANTYLGATRALKDYPAPYSYIMAGTTIASGLMSVAKIMGIGKATGGANVGAGYTGDGSAYSRSGYIPVHNGEVVFSQADVRSLGGVSNVESMRPTSNSFNQTSAMGDTSQLYSIVAQAVKDGSFAGTSRGTEQGQVRASTNRQIQKRTTF
ncbi:phage tail tape measure protein [uncultured Empedobacter sp.]|uniref:phage tail tape measure protein n=1 Tax=uncultured Empedobacter sp. TaxID=410844 RepID=UPI0025CDB2E2|nr:phage tail tape measure protein [uncultured Empedobacter sp.]